MGWGCYKHEWDEGSENWEKYAEKLCNEQLNKPGKLTWGRDGAICPKCYVDERTQAEKNSQRLAKLEPLIEEGHVLSQALDHKPEKETVQYSREMSIRVVKLLDALAKLKKNEEQ